MKKRLISLLSAVLLIILMLLPFSANAQSKYVVDEADLMTDSQEAELAQILEDYGITVQTGAEVTVLFVYSFDTISGSLVAEGTAISGLLEFAEGWNILFIVEGSELTVYLSTVDPNKYLDIGTFDNWTQTEPNLNYLLDAVVLSETVDKRGVYVKTNGEWADPYRTDDSDDVSLLGFGTYSDLAVRDEAVTGESIQDVPVYVQGGAGPICALYTYTADPQGLDYDDGVELVEIRQRDTGMPLRVLAVTVGGVRYAYFSEDYHNASGETIVSAGWNINDQPSAAPTITDFTPDRFSFGGAVYGDLDDLSDAAKSALRSLSQCINMSADAMGTIRVPDDAVLRFAGTIDPNRKYAFETGDDCTFTLPALSWDDKDAQFAMYLTCTVDIDLTFPQSTRFAGGTAPNSDAGRHKLIGCCARGESAWNIGGIDYEVQS